MANNLCVLLDHSQGRIRPGSLEVLAAGQQLAAQSGDPLQGLLLGRDLKGVAGEASRYQLAVVRVVEDDRLGEYNAESYAAALEQVFASGPPRLLLLAHSYQNIDLAPRLSALWKAALVTDCVGFRRKGEELVFVRQMFRNKLNADIRVHSRPPWIVTFQSGAFDWESLQAGGAPVESVSVDLSQTQVRRRSLEIFRASRGKVDLSQAEVVIGVGRGIKKEENLKLIQELAELLGAEIGASRPVVDHGWLERERQIGSSGQNISPRLYIAAGISGAIQHVVGMKGAKCVVAINSDPKAPIFNVAHYGIVGDLLEVVPALIRKLREESANA